MRYYLLLLMALLMLVSCGKPEMREGAAISGMDFQRAYPSMALLQGDNIARSAAWDIQAQPIQPLAFEAIPDIPIAEPYAFIVQNSPWDNVTWGKLYYSDGMNEPQVVFNGDAMSSLLKAGYIWFIEVQNYYIDSNHMLVIESRPARMDTDTFSMEYLAPMSCDPAWNYIVAESSDAYAIGKTDWDLQGELHITYHADSWVLSGSYLMPDMDGGMMVYSSRYAWLGETHLYGYDLTTRHEYIIHKVPDTIYRNDQDFEFWEVNYSKISEGTIGWTVVYFDKVNGGALDNVPYMNSTALPQGEYRWMGGISVDADGAGYIGSNYGHPQSALIYCDGEGSLVYDVWTGSYIDPWLCLSNDNIYYAKFNNSINKVDLHGFKFELARYGKKVRMVTSGRKASAM